MNANAKDQKPTAKKVKKTAKTELSKRMGQNMRLLRQQHKMTRQELSKHLGVSYQQVQKYEAGVNRISFEILELLRDQFHVSYDYFLHEEYANKYEANPEDVALSGYFLKRIKDISEPNERQKVLKIFDILCS